MRLTYSGGGCALGAGGRPAEVQGRYTTSKQSGGRTAYTTSLRSLNSSNLRLSHSQPGVLGWRDGVG